MTTSSQLLSLASYSLTQRRYHAPNCWSSFKPQRLKKKKCNYSLRLPYQPFTNFFLPTPPSSHSFSYIHQHNHAPPTSLTHMTLPPSSLALLIPPSSTNPSPALFSRQHTNHTQLPPPLCPSQITAPPLNHPANQTNSTFPH